MTIQMLGHIPKQKNTRCNASAQTITCLEVNMIASTINRLNSETEEVPLLSPCSLAPLLSYVKSHKEYYNNLIMYLSNGLPLRTPNLHQRSMVTTGPTCKPQISKHNSVIPREHAKSPRSPILLILFFNPQINFCCIYWHIGI